MFKERALSIPLQRQTDDQRRELTDANVVFWVPGRGRFRERVTLTHISNIDCSNGPTIIILCGAIPGRLEVPLKSAYVNGIRKLCELNRGQIVRLAGSGAAIVEKIWTEGDEHFGRFLCQDGLMVQLTEAEESMIGTLTKG